MKVSDIKTKLEEYDRLQVLIDLLNINIQDLDKPVENLSLLMGFLKEDFLELLKEKVEELKEKQRYLEIQ